MRAVIQRVASASVAINTLVVGRIERGLLVLVGIGHDDSCADAEWLAGKLVALRIFADENRQATQLSPTLVGGS